MASEEELVARAKAVWEESEVAMEKSMGMSQNVVVAMSVTMGILMVLCLVAAVWLVVKSRQKDTSTSDQISGVQKAEQEEMERRNILAEVYGHEASAADAFEDGLGDLELSGADLDKAWATLQHDAGHEDDEEEEEEERLIRDSSTNFELIGQDESWAFSAGSSKKSPGRASPRLDVFSQNPGGSQGTTPPTNKPLTDLL